MLPRNRTFLAKYMLDKAGRCGCGEPLMLLVLRAVTPIANPFDKNPVATRTLGGCGESGTFHLSADCVREIFEKRLLELRIINELFAGKDRSKVEIACNSSGSEE